MTTIPTGWKCKQEVIDIKYFLASSTKSIFIGLPHIHGVAWINRKWLENFGIHGNLIDYPEETVKLVDMVMSCSLSNESEMLNKIVSEVQIHHHTKSCRKYGTKCRFGFPKLPSKKTILAKPLPTEMDEDEKKQKLKQCTGILEKALEILESPDLDENMSIVDFIAKLQITEEEYYDTLKISKRGTVLILKRQVKERFVNSFNPEIQEALDCNTDFQVAFDPYSVASYMISYVSKDETGMTDFLKEVLATTKDWPHKEKILELKKCYLNHRQVGAPEAVYRSIMNMLLKDSNISTIFVQSGFPENRSTFFKKLPDDEEDDFVDDINEDEDKEAAEEVEETEKSEKSNGVVIKDRPGRYQPSTSIHDRYSARPNWLELICLAQFATSYVLMKVPPKRVKESKSFEEEDVYLEELSDTTVFNTDVQLPRYIKLQTGEFMRLRSYPMVLRYHNSKKKEGHEQHYSEMVLFHHWRNEEVEFKRNSVKDCIEVYQSKENEIEALKRAFLLGDDAISSLDDSDRDQERPSHVYDELDAQREQDLDDDMEEGMRDDPKYGHLEYGEDKANADENDGQGGHYDEPKYKAVTVPEKKEMDFFTRRLVSEQRLLLNIAVHYSKEVLKARSSPRERPTPFRIIIHGGAGNGKSDVIKVIAAWVEKILRKAGDHPNKPRVLKLAATGKAASLIGKFSSSNKHFLSHFVNCHFQMV